MQITEIVDKNHLKNSTTECSVVILKANTTGSLYLLFPFTFFIHPHTGLPYTTIKKRRRIRGTNSQAQNKYATWSTVSNIVINFQGDRWLLDLLSSDHMIRYLNVKSLCFTHETNIKLYANFNKNCFEKGSTNLIIQLILE